MPALPSRDVNIALIFVARRHREAFRGSNGAILDARHIVISRKLDFRHIEQPGQNGKRR